MRPYSGIDITAAWKNCFILLDSSDFHMTDNLSISVPVFASHVVMSFSVDATLFPTRLGKTVLFYWIVLTSINCFILLDSSDFDTTGNPSISVPVFASHVVMSFSVDATLFLR